MATVLDGVQVVEVADWGFVPSAGTALGDWGAEVVKIEHPRLGYAKGHGQGARGPDARRGGYDGVSLWARGGIADRLSTPGGPYVQQRPAFGDFIGGMCIAGGVAAALFRREKTGQGIELDVSLLGTALWVLSPDIVAALMYGVMLPSAGEMRVPPILLVGYYIYRDWKSVTIMSLWTVRHWTTYDVESTR